MPTPRRRRLPSVVNKNPGSVCVLDLPVGALRYLTLLLRLTSSAAAARTFADIVDEMRIKIDGKTVQRIDGSQFAYLRDFVASGYSGHSVGNDPFIKLRFAEMFRRTAAGEDALGWGMADVGTFQIEFDIAAGATAGELDFTGIYEYDPVSTPIAEIVQYDQFTVGANGAGKLNFNLSKWLPVYKLHCFTDKIEKATVTLNGNVLYELTKDESVADQSSDQLNPVSTVLTIPFDQRLRVSDFIDPRGAQEFSIEFEMASGAVPFQLVTERIGKHR